ncbi:hypothetical protein ABL840_26905 [Variovorax sp. NFACC27]|uniref:hypothetical protein n=1 Tax=unclassified Variovorax TaxID=663243 RepID=UPI00089B5E0E|nr:hypothetical protein SAMN03159371_03669 [Variovorax sp. NFACC28]SEG77903.1 hypothetical protein SAMN03159365_03748 [Variovorax sp. NFACC29]SFC96505.1 hypothetical protein SAMN03159379_03674 [Variovorax sp. NFACC26]SFG09537.1 hypothetical protein SAMN03159447_01783 [Variovorax sp. NFACC27]
MAKKSAAKRIARLESVCIGAGFLLRQLQARYGADFSHGMHTQVGQCLRDCQQIEAARTEREARAAAAAAPEVAG